MPRHKRKRRPTKRSYLNTIISQARHNNQPVAIIWDDIHLFYIPDTFQIVYATKAPADHAEQLIIRLPTRIPILSLYLTHGKLRITNLHDNTTQYLELDTAKDTLKEIYDQPTNEIINIIKNHNHSKENDDNCKALLRNMGTDPNYTTAITDQIKLYRREQ